MTVRVKKDSLLRFGTLVTLEGVEFWDVLDLQEIAPQPDDIQYTVLGSDRLDLLANRFYRSPRLKWVIMLANGMELEPSDVHEGDVIRIPSPRYVLGQLFAKAVQ